MTPSRRPHLRPLLLLAALATVSCGPRVERIPETGATLEGTVEYNGTPVPKALVIVAAPETGGVSMSAFADGDGNYRVENVPIGDVRIAVNTDATKGMMKGEAMSHSDPKAGKRATPVRLVEVPKKYHAPEASGLTTTTRAGVTRYDIKLPK
ncbi:carboxypeptidase regulatory-like domain-containing protein [bacterium]|nr:carboxypeptidase regulatory-like domain-containing protein [bacterium]